MTKSLFEENGYLAECTAEIIAIEADGALILDQTVFYPTGGGQPGDSGWLYLEDGTELSIVTTQKSKEVAGNIRHLPAEGQAANLAKFTVGLSVQAKIDWQMRYRYMRYHTAMHLLCATIPCGVTGGQIAQDKARLDFDLGEHQIDKQQIQDSLNQLIAQDMPVTADWISDADLDRNPELVRTLSVQPPRGQGQVRLIRIDDTDLQPCGGTHLRRTGEVGAIEVRKIENKGKRNRRISLVLSAPDVNVTADVPQA